MYKFLLNCPEPPAKKTKISEEKLEGLQIWEEKQKAHIPAWVGKGIYLVKKHAEGDGLCYLQ
jgi:hypothetical protein